jgi:hypothetical protein
MVCPHHSFFSVGSHWNEGHTFIDVLKIDIEGAEFDTLTTFLAANKPRNRLSNTKLPIGQLQLELHAWDDYANFAFFHGWWTALEAAGLRPFWTEPNLVYVNYAKGAKPQLAEVRGRRACDEFENAEWACLTVLVYEHSGESLDCIRCEGSRSSGA